MEKTVDQLELMFDKADTDLKHLTLRLERQLDLGKTKEGQNPVHLMKEIEGVKAEYTHLKQEIAGIQAAQKDAVDFLRSQLLSMSEMVQRLEAQSGQKNPELEESSQSMAAELSQLLGVPAESLVAPSKLVSSNCGAHGEEIPQGATSSGTHVAPEKSISDMNEAVCQQSEIPHQLSAAERRESSSEFVEISEEEFASVSELIRGRAKLEDVNRTYSLLWDYFKIQNNTQELTPKDMNAMGLRVSGATGQAKLKILRALKLCKIGKTGNVILT
ncbi:spindle and kinetochore-associated protein 2-like [Plakobranchus ocellatus]|uniref:Protein FAM33A n=1 Tax=Plakobranchus ocellatus TaxID=259542 RepID=A0AAV3ZXQ2_9GAST|nr:spindle and kinetochore-associated protein 2-like [Plakobranchus ocellatus]